MKLENAKLKKDRCLEPVRSVQCAVSRKTQKYINTRPCLNLYGQVSGEIQGHHVSVKPRSEPSVQDSSDTTSAAIMEIGVCQKKCRHFVFPKIVMSKCSI